MARANLPPMTHVAWQPPTTQKYKTCHDHEYDAYRCPSSASFHQWQQCYSPKQEKPSSWIEKWPRSLWKHFLRASGKCGISDVDCESANAERDDFCVIGPVASAQGSCETTEECSMLNPLESCIIVRCSWLGLDGIIHNAPCVELCKALRWNMKFRLIPPRNFVDKRILRHRLLEWFMESETQIPHPGMMWMDTKKKGAGRRCVVSTWKDTCRSSVGRRDDRPG